MLIHKATVIFQKILVLLLAALLLLNLYTIIRQVAFKEELPKVLGFAQVIVMSGSMQPALQVGDLLIIQEQKEYQVDDIVTFHAGNSLVTHRIIEINGIEAVTRGDENNVADAPSQLALIAGKVVLRIPRFGGFMLFLKTPLGILIMAILAVLLVEIPYLAEKAAHSKN